MQVEMIGVTDQYKILYYDIHNRRIISNYYIVRADNALVAYSQPNMPGAILNESNCLQTLTPQRLFTMNSLDYQSDAPVRSINTTITSIKKFSSKMKAMEKIDLEKKWGVDYIYSLNGEIITMDDGIRNRLVL